MVVWVDKDTIPTDYPVVEAQIPRDSNNEELIAKVKAYQILRCIGSCCYMKKKAGSHKATKLKGM
jgi:hypothetical protein